jgi:hypothetical protein
LGGNRGRDGTDYSSDHARHPVQIVDAASVVNAKLSVNHRLQFTNKIGFKKNVDICP